MAFREPATAEYQELRRQQRALQADIFRQGFRAGFAASGDAFSGEDVHEREDAAVAAFLAGEQAL